ncbi:hypothetical protein Tco_0156401 [Tanacetum coccineum]
MRIDLTKNQKEAIYQLTLDIIKQYSCYNAFLITIDVPQIYMQQFLYTISKNKNASSYQFQLDNQKFKIESWRTFLNIINRCLFGKSSGIDRARQPRVQILWGMFYKKNVDYAALIWEDFQCQIDSRSTSTKRREQIPYLRFTKVVSEPRGS